MAKLVGFAGSLRKGSFNRSLIAAAAAAMPQGSTLEVLPIDEVPLYDADVETGKGVPPPVILLKNRIAAADGLALRRALIPALEVLRNGEPLPRVWRL